MSDRIRSSSLSFQGTSSDNEIQIWPLQPPVIYHYFRACSIRIIPPSHLTLRVSEMDDLPGILKHVRLLYARDVCHTQLLKRCTEFLVVRSRRSLVLRLTLPSHRPLASCSHVLGSPKALCYHARAGGINPVRHTAAAAVTAAGIGLESVRRPARVNLAVDTKTTENTGGMILFHVQEHFGGQTFGTKGALFSKPSTSKLCHAFECGKENIGGRGGCEALRESRLMEATRRMESLLLSQAAPSTNQWDQAER